MHSDPRHDPEFDSAPASILSRLSPLTGLVEEYVEDGAFDVPVDDWEMISEVVDPPAPDNPEDVDQWTTAMNLGR